MEELIPVNILIADRTYRLKIEPADEEMVRKTASLINDKITEFKTNFAGKDMQDYIAMVIIWYATMNAGNSENSAQMEEIAKSLQKLESRLDKVG